MRVAKDVESGRDVAVRPSAVGRGGKRPSVC